MELNKKQNRKKIGATSLDEIKPPKKISTSQSSMKKILQNIELNAKYIEKLEKSIVKLEKERIKDFQYLMSQCENSRKTAREATDKMWEIYNKVTEQNTYIRYRLLTIEDKIGISKFPDGKIK